MKRTVALIGMVVTLWGCKREAQNQNPPAASNVALDSNLAAALKQPDRVTSLTLEESELDALPAQLWTLTNLRELNLTCQEHLAKLPPEIARLRALEKLEIDCGDGGTMNLSLPEEIGDLKQLKVLRLYGAMDPRELDPKPSAQVQFKELPEGIRKLGELKELDLGRNGFPHVPAQIASLENLEILNLSFNEIHDVPEFVGQLKQLHELALNSNGGLRLPASMSQMKGLTVIAGNDNLDLKTQASLRQRYPNITFDFENDIDDCSSNEPSGGYPDWQKQTCHVSGSKPK